MTRCVSYVYLCSIVPTSRLQGIENCGKSTSFGVVKYGLGAELQAAASSPDNEASLATWRNRLREVLSSDPEGITGGRRPAAANHVEDTFPNREVLEAYTRPLSSPEKDPRTPEAFLSLPDLTRITKLCEEYFEWATPGKICHKITTHVWPGAILRAILADITMAKALPVSPSTNTLIYIY